MYKIDSWIPVTSRPLGTFAHPDLISGNSGHNQSSRPTTPEFVRYSEVNTVLSFLLLYSCALLYDHTTQIVKHEIIR